MQRKKSKTVLVKVSIIQDSRARQSYTSIAWMMFHKIAHMYRYIRKQESEEATLLIIHLRANLNTNDTPLS